MLKYAQKFASIKNKQTFETSVTQQRYTNATIVIQKKLFIYVYYQSRCETVNKSIYI